MTTRWILIGVGLLAADVVVALVLGHGVASFCGPDPTQQIQHAIDSTAQAWSDTVAAKERQSAVTDSQIAVSDSAQRAEAAFAAQAGQQIAALHRSLRVLTSVRDSVDTLVTLDRAHGEREAADGGQIAELQRSKVLLTVDRDTWKRTALLAPVKPLAQLGTEAVKLSQHRCILHLPCPELFGEAEVTATGTVYARAGVALETGRVQPRAGVEQNGRPFLGIRVALGR